MRAAISDCSWSISLFSRRVLFQIIRERATAKMVPKTGKTANQLSSTPR